MSRLTSSTMATAFLFLGGCGGGSGGTGQPTDLVEELTISFPPGASTAFVLGQTLVFQAYDDQFVSQACRWSVVDAVTGAPAPQAGRFLDGDGDSVRFATWTPGNYRIRASTLADPTINGSRGIQLAPLEFAVTPRAVIPGDAGHQSVLGADLCLDPSSPSVTIAHSVRGTFSNLSRRAFSGALWNTFEVDDSPYPASQQTAALDVAVDSEWRSFVVVDPPDEPRTVRRYDGGFVEVPAPDFQPPIVATYLPAIATDPRGGVWVGVQEGATRLRRLAVNGASLASFSAPPAIDQGLCAIAVEPGSEANLTLYLADQHDVVCVHEDGSPEPRFSTASFAGDILDISADGLGRLFVSVQDVPDGAMGARSSIRVLNAAGQEVHRLESSAPPGRPDEDLHHTLAVAVERDGAAWVYDDLPDGAGAPCARILTFDPEGSPPSPIITLAPEWLFLKPGWHRTLTVSVPNQAPQFTWSATQGALVPSPGTDRCEYYAPAIPGTYDVTVRATIAGTVYEQHASITVTAFNYGFGNDTVTPGSDSHVVSGALAQGGDRRYFRFRNETTGDNYFRAQASDGSTIATNQMPSEIVHTSAAADSLGRGYTMYFEPGGSPWISGTWKIQRFDTQGASRVVRLGTGFFPYFQSDVQPSFIELCAGTVAPDLETTFYSVHQQVGGGPTNDFVVRTFVIPEALWTAFGDYELDYEAFDTIIYVPQSPIRPHITCDPEGRLLLYHWYQTIPGRIIRFLPDGTVDPTFQGLSNLNEVRGLAFDQNGLLHLATPTQVRVYGWLPSGSPALFAVSSSYSVTNGSGTTVNSALANVRGISVSPTGDVRVFDDVFESDWTGASTVVFAVNQH